MTCGCCMPTRANGRCMWCGVMAVTCSWQALMRSPVTVSYRRRSSLGMVQQATRASWSGSGTRCSSYRTLHSSSSSHHPSSRALTAARPACSTLNKQLLGIHHMLFSLWQAEV